MHTVKANKPPKNKSPGMTTNQAGQASAGHQLQQLQLVSNMFPITLPEGLVYHYDVDLNCLNTSMRGGIPEQRSARCESTVINRRVIASLAASYTEKLGGCLLAYDGRKNAYARQRLPFESHIFAVTIEENHEKREFAVQLTFASVVSFDPLHAMYDQQGSKDHFQTAIVAADIILRTAPTLAFVPVGRSFFSAQQRDPVELMGGRQAWSGFYTSIRLGSWKPLLNIDVSTTAFYKSIKVSEFAKEILRERFAIGQSLSDAERRTLQRELSGLFITCIHLEKPRKHRIEKLTDSGANRESFDYEGKLTTVAKYFLKKYQVALQHPTLPCVVDRRGNMIPMELCVIAAGQHCRRKLSKVQTSTMIRSTDVDPLSRLQKIIENRKKVDFTAKPYLNEFDMAIPDKPVEITGRVLASPRLAFGEKLAPVLPNDGAWRNKEFNAPAKLKKWALIVHGGKVAHIDSMIHTLIAQATTFGMEPNRPVYVNTFPESCSEREILEAVKGTVDVEITLVVLGRSTDYAVLKMEAETTDLCMRTQCVKEVNVNRKFNESFAENLLLKINTKCGGWNWRIWPDDRPPQLKQPYMIVGADVNHPAPGDNFTPSVAAVVASMDPAPSRYYATTSVQRKSKQTNRIEYIVDLETMFLECLQGFQTVTGGRLPLVIYFYRDGVSEGQLDMVRRGEIGALRNACAKLDPAYIPKMTFIVVQKRHHVRFAPKDKRHGIRNLNMPAGTVVDTDVVHPMLKDFYLCSQQGAMGTSVPAHYIVVHDDADHSLEEIEKLSYFLCHTYARCAKSVSIPAPIYYAHLAAARSKEYIKANMQGGRSDRSPSSDGSTSPGASFAIAEQVCKSLKSQMYFV